MEPGGNSGGLGRGCLSRESDLGSFCKVGLLVRACSARGLVFLSMDSSLMIRTTGMEHLLDITKLMSLNFI